MTQTLLTPDIIAAEGLIQLENNLVMSKLVYRDYTSEWTTGVKKGSTVRIRRPVQFTIRSGAIAQIQDIEEGNTAITIDKLKGVDFQFDSTELTLKIEDFSDRYIKPAMIQIANQVDLDMMTELYQRTYNWVGVPGQTINSFNDFVPAPQRLDNGAVPQDNRNAVLSPNDSWGLIGSFANGANFFQPEITKSALETARMPMLGNVTAYKSQNVVTHTVGAFGGSPVVKGASQNVTYASVMSSTTWSQSLNTTGWTTSSVLKAGDVFTMSGVYAVNPVSKSTLDYLEQFVLISNVTTNATNSNTTVLVISPPIITSGPYQTVSAAPADGTTITYVGTASTGYPQNLVFHRNAAALCVVPMELPGGAAKKSRFTKNGLSVRVIEVYDGVNDVNMWRFDVLYGVKTIDPRLSVRLSGAS